MVSLWENIKYRVGKDRLLLARFIEDLAGVSYDFYKFIFTSVCYLLAGMFIVGVPLYPIAVAFTMFD
ncbi:hypothetical protein ACFFHH_24235 [Cytobacillus solani]|uniref:Uncharacterized protein n=1 Tax=Cytobacillus solani TaxID=1637975 RepID=A0A0Q3VHK5_9BACI|nr:hypothetical protein [Cytobacillus solani]KQL19730.1 hypothetical protein AN957_14900 [Cytobacillus solani]USK52961.1 hypothetical protein LIS82_15145 [Cytobacillus solani]